MSKIHFLRNLELWIISKLDEIAKNLEDSNRERNHLKEMLKERKKGEN